MHNNGIALTSGIRVWRGYRSSRYLHNYAGFAESLKGVFIPQTSQQLTPLGLLNYFPAIVPESKRRSDVFIPDEVALVIYPSKDDYDSAQTSVAGKAYGALHSTVFNFDPTSLIPKSTSDNPRSWHTNWDFGQSYSLLDNDIDWRLGSTSVFLAKPKCGLTSLMLKKEITRVVTEWLGADRGSVDLALLCVEQDWVLCWEHCSPFGNRDEALGSLIEKLMLLTENPILNSQARQVTVAPLFSRDDAGVICDEGELLSVQVESAT
jgi:hypothetical protein